MPSSKRTENATTTGSRSTKPSKPAKGAASPQTAVPPAPTPADPTSTRRPPPGPTPIHGHVMSAAERQARRQAKLKTAAAVADVRIALREQAIHQALTSTEAALDLLRRQIDGLIDERKARGLDGQHGQQTEAAGAAPMGTAEKAAQAVGKGAEKATARQRSRRPAAGVDAALHELQAAAAAIAASLEPLRPYARAYTAPLPALENNGKEGNDDDTGSLF